MNTKNTWLLLLVALGLGAFIFGWEKFVAGPARQPAHVLPGFEPARVTAVQIRVSGQPELLAERTNGGWRLTRPIPYPAQPQRVELFLAALRELRPVTALTARDLQNYPNAESDFGFDQPLATIHLFTGERRQQLVIGARTAPGTQLYVQSVGDPGVQLVPAALLDAVPQTAGAWRDPALLDWAHLDFDRILAANGPRVTELQREGTNGAWRLPRQQARADGFLLGEMLNRLRTAQITEFITDAPNADLEAFGLRAPELVITFLRGTNVTGRLNLGKSPTNDAKLVYARRTGLDSVFTVPAEPLAAWRSPAAEFRDRLLVNVKQMPDALEVVADDRFRLSRQTNAAWTIEPGGFPVDTNAVNSLLLTLARMQIVAFEKDVVTEPDLPKYGLTPPFREFHLLTGNSTTNPARLTLAFGTNHAGRILVKRSDEESIYAVAVSEFNRLPAASWELRERRVWSFPLDELVKITVQRQGQQRELLRQASNSWSLAEGSAGAINVFGVEETAARLVNLDAAFWTLRHATNLAAFGFSEPEFRVSLLTRGGQRREVRFGGAAPNQFPYALVQLDGEPWLFEFPWATYQLIEHYLCPPVP